MYDLAIEKSILADNYNSIAAIDEAGRGPLAGPVVAACVVFTGNFDITREKAFFKIRDSKTISEKSREELYELIINNFSGIGIGVCDHSTIDRINILQATFLAMKKAIGSLKNKPDYIILDGKIKIPNLSIPQSAIVKGDSLSFSIAAASIVAKVFRDRLMRELHQKYPDYGFDKHKGYGTKIHIERIKTFGACEIHRKTFAPLKNRKL